MKEKFMRVIKSNYTKYYTAVAVMAVSFGIAVAEAVCIGEESAITKYNIQI